MIFFAFSFLWSCEKDDGIEEINQQISIKSHTSNTFLLNKEILNEFNSARAKLSLSAKSFYDEANQFWIQDSSFVRFSVGEYESFTFNITDSTDLVYQKHLVLAKKLNGDGDIYYQSYLARTPLDDLNARGNIPGDILSANVVLTKIGTNFQFQKGDGLDYEVSGNCTSVYHVTTGDACRGQIITDCGHPCKDGNCNNREIVIRRVLISQACGPTSGGGLGGPAVGGPERYDPNYDPSEGGGGLTDPDGDTPFGTIENDLPTESEYRMMLLREKAYDDFIDQLDYQELRWLNHLEQQIFRRDLERYIYINALNPFLNPEDFANAAVDAKSGDRDVEVDFENEIIFNLNFIAQFFEIDPYNTWRSLTDDERDLISREPFAAWGIYQNREIAVQETIRRFGQNGRNNKADAFRHAYYNALNAEFAGVDLAEEFGNAHESETPQELSLEKEMDLFNNEAGRNLIDQGETNSELSDAVFSALEQGELRYLSPLDPAFSSIGGINPNTRLIPTNQ